jgi:quinoprotein glucose dehydrogenase
MAAVLMARAATIGRAHPDASLATVGEMAQALTPFLGTAMGNLINAPASWGAPNLGGPLVTASGLIFIGATPDGMFRALDMQTGSVLWQQALPYPGVATPMSFQAADGRQFVVIAAGGSILLQSPIGDALVAFALAPK